MTSVSRPFASVLARVRREQGFPNPHAFYKARDGRRGLGLTFPNYLALEKGRSLPKPQRLTAILDGLGLAPGAPSRNELVRAYLASLLGSDALLREIEAPAPAPAPELGVEEVARQALRQRAVQLGLDQWRALAADPVAYRCHVYLVNTPGWREESEVARALGAPAGKTRAALKALAKARIVEVSGGRARSPFAYKFLQTLPLTAATAHLKAPILKAREAFAAGPSAKRHNVTTRLTAANLERYFAKLAETVTLSGVYGDAEKSADSAVYFVDARVVKLFD